MRNVRLWSGLLCLLALSAHAAKISPESLIHGPYIPPSAAQLRVAVGGNDDVRLFAWVDNGRVWVKSTLGAQPTMLPSSGAENVLVGGIAYNEGRFLVTWIQDGAPLAARVSREGAVLDGVPIRVGAASNDIDVIADPQGFRVFVDQQQNGFGMARITAAGQLLDPAPVPIGTGRPQTVLANADRFAWLQSSSSLPATPTSQGLIIVRFNSRPANNEPSPGVLSFGTAGVSRLGFMDPALATNGSTYMVFWHNGHEIRGARLNGDGTPIDTSNGMLMAVDAIAPAASPKPVQALWDGAKYLVVWEDMRPNGNIDLKAAYVMANGAATWFDISAGDADERAPALHLLDPGRVLVVYQKIGPLSTEIVSRVVSEKRERVINRR